MATSSKYVTTEYQSSIAITEHLSALALEVSGEGFFLWTDGTFTPLNPVAQDVSEAFSGRELNKAFRNSELVLQQNESPSEIPFIVDSNVTEYSIRLVSPVESPEIRFLILRSASREKEMQKHHSECSSDIAHDLKSPLSTILVVLERCHEQSLEIAPAFSESLGKAVRDCRKVLGLVREVLDYTTLDAAADTLETARLNGRAITEETAQEFLQLRGMSEITYECIGDGLHFHGDSKRVRQALRNLIGNALMHTQPGSSIIARTYNQGGALVFEVLDNGPGIPEEVKESVWLRYTTYGYRNKGEFPGTGLGLAIVKKIVELHGGRCGIEDRPEGGCRVWMSFPISSD